jgi:hypothetical protein
MLVEFRLGDLSKSPLVGVLWEISLSEKTASLVIILFGEDLKKSSLESSEIGSLLDLSPIDVFSGLSSLRGGDEFWLAEFWFSGVGSSLWEPLAGSDSEFRSILEFGALLSATSMLSIPGVSPLLTSKLSVARSWVNPVGTGLS